MAKAEKAEREAVGDHMPRVFDVDNWDDVAAGHDGDDTLTGTFKPLDARIRMTRRLHGWGVRVRITVAHGGVTVPLLDAEPDDSVKALWAALDEERFRREARLREGAEEAVYKAAGCR